MKRILARDKNLQETGGHYIIRNFLMCNVEYIYYQGYQIKDIEVGEACSTHRRYMKYVRHFGR